MRRGGRGRTSKGNKALSFAHCFCLVTFLLKFHSPVFGKGSCCKNNHRAKSNDPTLCQVPHPPTPASPAPHRLARVQCSLCALLVSIAKSCVLEVCCCPPYTDSTPVFPCHSHLNFALRRFAVFRVRAFHTKKCKIRAKFTSNVELTGSW